MFAKKNRLSKSKDVQAVFAGGRVFFNPYFSLKAKKNGLMPRFTVVVSTKVSKKAVHRNRIKRVVREFLKLKTPLIFPADYVVIVKPALIKISEKLAVESLQNLMIKARVL
jgi:ribonuclease P protein component